MWVTPRCVSHGVFAVAFANLAIALMGPDPKEVSIDLNQTHLRHLFSGLLLSACVSPEVVQTNRVNDQSLSCSDIKVQLMQLAEIRTEAAKGQKVSGKNVAAAILFWPTVIGNHQNAKQALEAAEKRNDVLVALAKEKRCNF